MQVSPTVPFEGLIELQKWRHKLVKPVQMSVGGVIILSDATVLTYRLTDLSDLVMAKCKSDSILG